MKMTTKWLGGSVATAALIVGGSLAVVLPAQALPAAGVSHPAQVSQTAQTLRPAWLFAAASDVTKPTLLKPVTDDLGATLTTDAAQPKDVEAVEIHAADDVTNVGDSAAEDDGDEVKAEVKDVAEVKSFVKEDGKDEVKGDVKKDGKDDGKLGDCHGHEANTVAVPPVSAPVVAVVHHDNGMNRGDGQNRGQHLGHGGFGGGHGGNHSGGGGRGSRH